MSALLLLSFLCAFVWFFPYFGSAESAPREFTATFLEVGQGDAILIETPEGIEVLVDGGRNSRVLSELTDVLGAFDRTLDMIVATHPDADHIGGLNMVLERYEVARILMTENKNESSVAEAFLERAAVEGADITYARTGQQFALGASTTIEVLFPFENPADMESNASSIILKVTYGESSILLTGDAPKRIETYLTEQYGTYLSSEILKIGHHGSRTSTDLSFVQAVAPQYGVISAGADNSYGHPHQEVLDTLTNQNVSIVTTINGRAVFTSNGINFELQ